MQLQSRERHDKLRRAVVTDLYERAYTKLKHGQTGSYDKLFAGDSLPNFEAARVYVTSQGHDALTQICNKYMWTAVRDHVGTRWWQSKVTGYF